MVCTALVSASSGPGLSPEARDIASCTARHFILIVPVSTLVYKWVPAKLMLGVTLQWTNIPCRGKGAGGGGGGGSRNAPSRFVQWKPG